MALEEYQSKRRFDSTPEPQGGKGVGGPPAFVVQKHEARQLHYDFRLEALGVMWSWAVPKGPSLNPESKHLAMHVEDHPLDYRHFEGIIPEGNYGAGTVMIWDQGNYLALNTTNRADSEKAMKAGLAKGHLTFVLNGQKLKGEFALIKLQRADDDAWLLIKKDDEYANRKRDILKQDKSAASSRTMKQIESKPDATWASQVDLEDAPKTAMPHRVRPMLAEVAEAAFDDPDWLFEIKWDGYRAIAEVEKGKVRLYSRNLQPFEERFKPVFEALKQFPHQAILDGEIAAVDERGRGKFQLLQNYQRTGEGRLVYYIFDLLYLNGHDLTGWSLERRKEVLQKILPESPMWQYSDHIKGQGTLFFRQAVEQGLEGMMAKRADSPYLTGKRVKAWLKVRASQRQEAIIAGWTEPRGGRHYFGALVLALKDKDGLRYIGHTGTGFDDATLKEVSEKLKPLETKQSPFAKEPKTNAPAHWVRPELVCEVGFSEWTGDGSMRHPVFLGLRLDKPAGQVVPERPTVKGSDDTEVTIDGHKVKLTNLNKVFWPEEGYTKNDLIDYYRSVAKVLLPHLKDRPESLNRYPNGINGQSFYQKNVEDAPGWAETIDIASEHNKDKRTVRYLLCQNEATLVYMANLACIELHPWFSRLKHLDEPDCLIIDLDPEDIEFAAVVETAQVVHKVLEQAGIVSYCKTSGATGLHIYVPTAAKYGYEPVRQFGQLIANLVHQQLPKITSIERSPAKRQQRVYLDYLQNSRGQTAASVYSVRPRPGAPVSTPLDWSEVRKGLDPTRFTIKTLPPRLQERGDLWKPVLGKGVDIKRALAKLEEMDHGTKR